MSRMKIEKNIAWDDVKKKYYVTLYFGKDGSGAIIKKTVTTTIHTDTKSLLHSPVAGLLTFFTDLIIIFLSACGSNPRCSIRKRHAE